MEIMTGITILLYIMGSGGYVAFLFGQKDILYRTGFYLLIAGFACHSLTIGYGTLELGHIPVQNLHQTLSIACWAIVAVFLGLQYRFNLKILGIYAAPLAALIMLAAYQLPREPATASDLFNNLWLVLHIVAIFVGEAALALAFGVGVLYMLQEHTIKSKHHGFFYRRLPSLELLDQTGYACIVVGFAMLSLGLISGFVYAKSVWGKFWTWDPKEVWSGITWLIYAALVHQRLTVGWRGRRAAGMAIIGFLVVLFTFFGVNFLMGGHHGEFTRW